MYDKLADWTYSGGGPERSLNKDEMLDDITLYWPTNTSTSATQLYWENKQFQCGRYLESGGGHSLSGRDLPGAS
jgi:hypothetical protein